MSFSTFASRLNDFAWDWWLIILLLGTGIFYTIFSRGIQFRRFGYAMKNTIGKIFHRQKAGEGEVTPFQAVTTALAATVGTGNISGVTTAIVVGGPGAVFWLWISGLFGMAVKYAEVVLAVKYRERNASGDWVGGPMYYIKNGLGSKWKWLGVLFCIFGGIAAFGIGNMTQINNIADFINNAINSLGGDAFAHTITAFGQTFPVSSLVIGVIVAALIGLVLFGGIKRIGAVAEKLIPLMAVVYILAGLVVIFGNITHIGKVFALIFKGAFSPDAAIGAAVGIAFKTTIKKGISKGLFSNEAGLGSAPMAHAASSESNPVKQGLYGIFEVFMDTIVICTLTSLIVLSGYCAGVDIVWGETAGATVVSASLATIFGGQFSALLLAICLTFFAFSTILGWSLYGTRCCEFLFGEKSTRVYQVIFILFIIVGSTLTLTDAWNIAEALNGFMAVPNLVALLALSPVVVKISKEYFNNPERL